MNQGDLIGLAALFIIIGLPMYILYYVVCIILKNLYYKPAQNTVLTEQERIDNLEKTSEVIFFILLLQSIFGRY
jgi:hypothetical protein